MTLNVGVIGCGNISDTYFRNAPLFSDIRYVACADLDMAAAKLKAETYGVTPSSVDALLNRDDIDAVLNLTVPVAHAEIALRAIAAGKHVYTEKPLAVSLREGRDMLEAARIRGVRIGSAPDTVLGPGLQTARRILDAGEIGMTISGLGAVQSHGMEHWHPNPEFFFKKGGGPVLDIGPYYVGALVHVLGPVKRVKASGSIGYRERVVQAEGPAKGNAIKVETFTTLHALLTFASGAEIVLLASWDVWNSDLRPLELHGTMGTLRIPDPNLFSGPISVSTGASNFRTVETAALPFGAGNRDWDGDGVLRYSCYRGLGLAEMASAIERGTVHRCSAEVGYHVLETLLAIEEAAAENCVINLRSTCERPARFDAADAEQLMSKPGLLA